MAKMTAQRPAAPTTEAGQGLYVDPDEPLAELGSLPPAKGHRLVPESALAEARKQGANAMLKAIIGDSSGGFIPREAGIKDKNGQPDDWVSVGWVFECHKRVVAEPPASEASEPHSHWRHDGDGFREVDCDESMTHGAKP